MSISIVQIHSGEFERYSGLHYEWEIVGTDNKDEALEYAFNVLVKGELPSKEEWVNHYDSLDYYRKGYYTGYYTLEKLHSSFLFAVWRPYDD